MTDIITRGQQLKTMLEAALGDLVDLVTLDGEGIKPSTRAAVIIQPPELSFPNFGERDTTWTFTATAGPADRPLIALEALDKIITRLEEHQFNIAKAEPTTLDLGGAARLPAYDLTLNPE